MNNGSKYILSIDQGTTSSRAVLFDKNGNAVKKSQKEFKQIYPRAGWVEHDPEDIFQSQLEVMRDVVLGADVLAVGIANQRETVIVWDKTTGKAVYNAIVWQCRRTAQECERLINEGYEELIYERTGLPTDAYFSATKLKWILDNVDGARERAVKGELLFGTVDSFLMWRLTDGKVHATDYTNASRTMLFNIHKLDWDEDLLKIFDIPRSMLPKVCPSGHIYGEIAHGLPCGGVKIAAVAGDQQAALFGQLCFKKGQVKNTYGTGCFLLMNTKDVPVKSNRGMITTLAASMTDGRPDYALEGSVFMAGAIVQWLRDEMKIIESAAETEAVANSVPDTQGVYIVPAFVGLGAPYWDSEARGTVTGLTRGANRAHFVRAALEAIAYQVFDLVHAMGRDLGQDIDDLCVDGGASENNFLMKFQADILGAKVLRPSETETTALGVCYLSALTVGAVKSTEQLGKNRKATAFEPTMDASDRERLIEGWKLAVLRARWK